MTQAYAASNELAGTKQAITTSYKTLLALTAQTSGLRRAKVFEVMIGTGGTPADTAYEFDISRQTNVGTSTSVTPNPVDPGDPACATVGSANFTSEGSITATSSLFYLAINQKASYRWVARDGMELVIPAINLAGVAIRTKSPAGTAVAGAQAYFTE